MASQNQDIAQQDKLKVFISYSRADVSFSEELELALRDKGFEPLVDRHGIDAGDDWKKRLGELILSADTVVFVLTDTSAASDICAWEAEEAARLSKRMLVVTMGPVAADIARPPQLAGINWISCWRNPALPGSSQTKGFLELETALRTDVAWLRQQTALQEQAARWSGRGAAPDSPYLLRGDVLSEALAWARRSPAGADVPASVQAFLHAGEAYEAKLKAEAQAGLAEKEAALQLAAGANRRVRNATMIGAGVAGLFLIAALIAGFFGFRNLQEADRRGAQVAEISSNIKAREAAAIREAASGDFTTVMLMALQADPAAQRDALSRKFAGKKGYDAARAQLAAATANNALRQVFKGHELRVTSVAFAPDGQSVLTGAEDNTARLWDARNGAPLRSFAGHEGVVLAVAFAPDGQSVLTGSSDKSARLWDARNGAPLRSFAGHEGVVLAVAFSPDGNSVLTGSGGITARLWDASNGALLGRFVGHEGGVFSVAFSPDDQSVLTGSDDKTARLWDASNGALLRRFVGHEGWVFSVAFAPDGKSVLTGSWDNTARLWPVPEALLVDAKTLVRTACTALWQANAKLAFTAADAQIYPVLQGEPIDPANGDFVSPCKGVLPETAFAKSAASP